MNPALLPLRSRTWHHLAAVTTRAHSALCVLGVAAAALLNPAKAQEWVGFDRNVTPTYTSRGALGVLAGQVLTRLDGDEHAGWGTDGPPGWRQITALRFTVQDQNILTPEFFHITLYPEGAPGYPLWTAGVPFAVNVAGPWGSTAVPGSLTLTISNTVSVPILGGGDIFVAFDLPANAQWPNDGLSLWNVAAVSTLPNIDVPGPVQSLTAPPGPDNSHGLTFRPNSVPNGAPLLLAYDRCRQHILDVRHGWTQQLAGGVGGAVTNQTSYPISGAPPGTADFLSGSNPDVNGFSVGRADDICMEIHMAGAGGMLAFFQIGLDTGFGPEIPMSSFGPGYTGVVCLPLNAGLAGVIALPVGDQAVWTLPLPGIWRPFLIGHRIYQQAFLFDPTNGVIHASPCDMMAF